VTVQCKYKNCKFQVIIQQSVAGYHQCEENCSILGRARTANVLDNSTEQLCSHRQTKSDECQRLQSGILQVTKCTPNIILAHSIPSVCLENHRIYKALGTECVSFFSTHIFIPINIYQVMFDIQTKTCVDT
jgi:hypothetical protein